MGKKSSNTIVILRGYYNFNDTDCLKALVAARPYKIIYVHEYAQNQKLQNFMDGTYPNMVDIVTIEPDYKVHPFNVGAVVAKMKYPEMKNYVFCDTGSVVSNNAIEQVEGKMPSPTVLLRNAPDLSTSGIIACPADDFFAVGGYEDDGEYCVDIAYSDSELLARLAVKNETHSLKVLDYKIPTTLFIKKNYKDHPLWSKLESRLLSAKVGWSVCILVRSELLRLAWPVAVG
jgi:hypothetical protein